MANQSLEAGACYSVKQISNGEFVKAKFVGGPTPCFEVNGQMMNIFLFDLPTAKKVEC